MPDPASNHLTATVVIASKNRKDELRRAVASAIAQLCKPEVLVMDDASTDGTREMIQNEFPQVRLESASTSRGYIVQRNRGAELASGDVVFSIDDDAAFSTPNVVGQIVDQFDHPRIGALTIPFINVNQNPEILQSPPAETGHFALFTYVGTAHAVRRDIFLKLGGYRDFFFHQGEEGDFCTRMLQEGYVVAMGRSDPIHHFESPKRDRTRMDLYGRRNDILFSWCNVPFPYLPVHMTGTILNGLKLGARIGRTWNMVKGVGMGLKGIFQYWGQRRPISRSTYRLMRELKQQPMVFDQVIDRISHR